MEVFSALPKVYSGPQVIFLRDLGKPPKRDYILGVLVECS